MPVVILLRESLVESQSVGEVLNMQLVKFGRFVDFADSSDIGCGGSGDEYGGLPSRYSLNRYLSF